MISSGPVVSSEFIYDRAPFPACHASTIVETRSGALLAAWFGGTKEGASDVCIYLSRKIDKGWSIPVKVARGEDGEGNEVPCWNPVLFQPDRGPLTLYYKVGRTIAGWTGWERSSDDDGATWGPERELPRGILGPIKNKPIQLLSGRVVAGSSEEKGGWRIHFEISDDRGASWRRGGPVIPSPLFGAIQPSLLMSPAGELIAVGRTDFGKVFHITSADEGDHWGHMSLLNLSNPNSGIDAVTLRSGLFLLAYNDSQKKRTPLNIATSSDGVHWTNRFAVEKTPGEFSYPSIIQTQDGMVHLVYTWNRKKIKHVVLDPNLLGVQKG